MRELLTQAYASRTCRRGQDEQESSKIQDTYGPTY